ncbi:MAG TPA: DUF2169 domain-containing protein [Bryobacteraceae bacterium]|nr:DUF2169 domain-containing protein [Bryobacteraceae bacterium]
MKLDNLTAFPAKMLVGSTSDREMVAMVACKVTYIFGEDGLVPAPAEESWPVFEQPFVFESALLPAELDFRKNGADVAVFGKVRTLDARPTRHMRVGIYSGSLSYEVDVHGDRWWRRYGRGLVATEAEPFVEMPITNDRAYGGSALLDGMPVSYAENPAGRGYYLSEEEAENKPLPNLERPGVPISRWDDRPSPAVFYKTGPGIRPDEIQTLGEDAVVAKLMAEGFNGSIPELVADPAQLGSSILLRGFSHAGDIVLPAPHRSGPVAHASVGALRSRFPSTIASIVMLADIPALAVTYLSVFRYLMRPMEKRTVELRWREDPRLPMVQS